jgi:hypothetical protein
MPGEQHLHREPVASRDTADQQFVCRCLHRPGIKLMNWSRIDAAGFKCP